MDVRMSGLPLAKEARISLNAQKMGRLQKTKRIYHAQYGPNWMVSNRNTIEIQFSYNFSLKCMLIVK